MTQQTLRLKPQAKAPIWVMVPLFPLLLAPASHPEVCLRVCPTHQARLGAAQT